MIRPPLLERVAAMPLLDLDSHALTDHDVDAEPGVELMRIPEGGLVGHGPTGVEPRHFQNLDDAVRFAMEQLSPAERELAWIRMADDTLTYREIVAVYESLATRERVPPLPPVDTERSAR
jgi:hypothetical protein